MRCPYCGYFDSLVLDSRPVDEKIRRRRECKSCHRRFTTYEEVEHAPLIVIKKDKTREEFSREKLLTSFRRACIKRDVPSQKIGELAMRKLVDIDDVAYVRFASVYKDFKDIDTFKLELENITKNEEN